MTTFCDGLVGQVLDLSRIADEEKNTHAAWLMAAIISTSKSNSCDSQIQIQTHVTNWFMRQSNSFF